MAMAGIIAVAVIALGLFAYKALKPASYTPSPGVAGNPADDPWLKTHPNQPQGGGSPSAFYPSAPAGSMPGRPPGLPRNNGQ